MADNFDFDHAEWSAHYLKFFALAGQCVIEFQAVEEFLEPIFLAAMGGDTLRASIVYREVRGRDRKLAVVKNLLADRKDPGLTDAWKDLQARVNAAADARDQIAHGSAGMFGGGFQVKVDPITKRPASITRASPPRMELRKKGKEAVWTIQELREEMARLSALDRDLIDFRRRLAEANQAEVDYNKPAGRSKPSAR